MKKAFDQTIRDLKREVNKKVLKVPSIEQKVLDATSNEPWGPHGSLLADIAEASRNYHEYQMIMTIMWKRINSTGKNWRHVYKALTVMEYMVANGSERVIDEIREHAYQISTLSSFQYIDSSGRDQGLNVRRKSQSLVSLVNDKEKIQEVREKAAANRDKFRSASMGGRHETGSYSGAGYGDRYDDERYAGRYGSRDDERNGYGREGEWSNRDNDRYGRYADSYSRNEDRCSRDSEERYGRGSSRDDDYRGRYADESGSRSSERDRDRTYDDEHHSSRGSSVKAEDHPQEGRPLEQKFSEQSTGAPPSYEEAIGGSKSPVYSERDGEAPAAPLPKPTSPNANITPGQTTVDQSSSWSDPNNHAEAVDEFDPRGSIPAVSGTSSNAEVDLLGSLSDSWAITPVSSSMSSTDPNAAGNFSESQFTTTSSPPTMNQSFEDPFGDSPFKAVSSPDDVTSHPQNFASVSSFQPSAVNYVDQNQQGVQTTNNFGDLEVQDTFSTLSFSTPDASSFQVPSNAQPMQQEPLSLQNDDILAGILPPAGPPPPAASQTLFTPPAYQPYNAPNFVQQSGPPHADSFPIAAQNHMMPTSQDNSMNFLPHPTPAPSMAANPAPQLPVTVPQQTHNVLGDLLPHAGPAISPPSYPTSAPATGSLAIVSQPAPKQKFELKSAVWADTLSRGLVDLNISGPKVNPNAGIGVDFDSLNRKEKRMEKPTAAPVASTINMGKAMGSGSGMGRSGGGMIRPQSNPMAGSGVGMGMAGASGGSMGMGMGGAPGVGMGGAPGVGMGMGGYGMMNQRPNMGMGMGQGVPMMNQHPASNMSSGYNPMMGRGGYPPQQPYGSGYQ